MKIASKWAIRLLDIIPFHKITGDNAIGRISRQLGIVGVENVKDMIPFVITYEGTAIDQTTLHISWLGLVRKYASNEQGIVPYVTPDTETIATEWLLFLPFSLFFCRENLGRLTTIRI